VVTRAVLPDSARKGGVDDAHPVRKELGFNSRSPAWRSPGFGFYREAWSIGGEAARYRARQGIVDGIDRVSLTMIPFGALRIRPPAFWATSTSPWILRTLRAGAAISGSTGTRPCAWGRFPHGPVMPIISSLVHMLEHAVPLLAAALAAFLVSRNRGEERTSVCLSSVGGAGRSILARRGSLREGQRVVPAS
jgi:hypothetical protein